MNKISLIFGGLFIIFIAGVFYFNKSQVTTQPPTPSVPITTADTSEVTPSTYKPVSTEAWQSYSNSDPNFSFLYPLGWKITKLPIDQIETEIPSAIGVKLEGKEGELELWWGSGFGGGCGDQKYYKDLQIKGETLKGCNAKTGPNEENWWATYKEISKTLGFSIAGSAFHPTEENRNTILTIISTLNLPE